MIKSLSIALMILSAVVVASIRIVGIDLTECQLLVEYGPWWAFSIISVLAGLALYGR